MGGEDRADDGGNGDGMDAMCEGAAGQAEETGVTIGFSCRLRNAASILARGAARAAAARTDKTTGTDTAGGPRPQRVPGASGPPPSTGRDGGTEGG